MGEGTEDLLDYTYRTGQSHLSTISFPFLVLAPPPPPPKILDLECRRLSSQVEARWYRKAGLGYRSGIVEEPRPSLDVVSCDK